uniref:Peptidase S1 domain-containing protein n=1 Tax=Anopheles coluzzii TaxID=1518534 RepID=A0A6E8W6F9_ANOCL
MASLMWWTVSALCLAAGIVAQNVEVSTNSEQFCTTSKGEDGICVYQYQCTDGVVSHSGENIIDIRHPLDDCNDHLMQCCAEPKQATTIPPITDGDADDQVTIVPPSSTASPTTAGDGDANDTQQASKRPPVHIPPYEIEGCGHRNPHGVIFTIENNQFSESEYGEYPWTVAIFARTKTESALKYLCGGALIDRAAVLTTASCLHPYRSDVSSLVVRLGEWDMSTVREPIPHIDSEMERIYLHPQYSMTSKVNDIAIVILGDTVELNHTVGVVCLPPAGMVPSTGNDVTGVGWGEVPNFVVPRKLPQTILKKAQLHHLSHELCQQTLRKLMGRRFQLHSSFLCTTAQDAEMLPCRGDTGSPYMMETVPGSERYYLVGLSSWGYDCNKQATPTVLTNVAYHRDWIDGVIKGEDLNIWSYTYEKELLEGQQQQNAVDQSSDEE